ncbi:MAG: rhomboid family intramembrane serine protease [Clostridia bacterium]|nr:rhomboid family intramembrane serine protease [Clostridia bacterium]MCI1999415.1 rhomboid family intramembrane serine protease [Clostridia bacterium]MCI2015083.1 rhomboid family intramembrane serine protease [Clostridia bacterium]
MYSDFFIKFKTSMNDSDFTSMIPNETSASVSIYIRISNPVVYLVQVFNCDMISFESIEDRMPVLEKNIESKLNQMRCTNAVVVNLLYTDNIKTNELKKYCDSKEPDYSKLNNVWWYTDGKNLFFGKNQPTKVFGIQNTIYKSLSDNFDFSKNKTSAYKESKKNITPIVTYSLIAINAVIWLLLNMFGTDTAYIFANNGADVFQNHQFYRLFTCMFIHISFVHLFYNCFSLYIFGRICEKCFGYLKYTLIYIASGIIASFVSALFLTGYSIGASGAVYGIMGALLAYVRINKRDVQGFNYPTLFLFIVAGIGLSMMDKNVDNFAHMGGVIFGFLMVFIIEKINKAVNKCE